MESVLHWVAQASWQHLALAAALISLVGFAVWQSARERRSSAAYLRHAIAVNLGILRKEHGELTRIASSQSGPDKVKAVGLLANVQATMTAVGTDMTRFSNRKLGNILGQVFEAMNKSTTARRLLGACHPAMLE